MLSKPLFIQISLEVNLFFARIMKEHLFFIENNLPPAAAAYQKQAVCLKENFTQLLEDIIQNSQGALSSASLKSQEMVTPYTLLAEKMTQAATGAPIDTEITQKEIQRLNMSPTKLPLNIEELDNFAYQLNEKAADLLQATIAFQENLFFQVTNCRLFISLYPEMMVHDNQETKHYFALLEKIQNRQHPQKILCEELNFWNHIMEEHAAFIDGMLDPTETDLKKKAQNFQKIFAGLVGECVADNQNQIQQNSLTATKDIRSFKTQSIEGILECKIKSIILPLLADHVLREANHYLRLLSNWNQNINENC